MSDQKYWLGFSLVSEIGAKRLSLLQNWFGELESAWTATETQLHQSGLEKQPVANILSARKTLDLDAEMAKVHKAGAWLVTLIDDAYPAQLKKLPDAPPVLYIKGSLVPPDERCALAKRCWMCCRLSLRAPMKGSSCNDGTFTIAFISPVFIA